MTQIAISLMVIRLFIMEFNIAAGSVGCLTNLAKPGRQREFPRRLLR